MVTLSKARRVTQGGAISTQPVVPGFITTGEVSTNATGSEWLAVRTLDGHRFVIKEVAVADVAQALVLAVEQMATYDRIQSKHLVRRHSAVATSDGTLLVVLDEVGGGSLAQLLGARGQLTPGETVTTVAPLFRALADLHDAGIVHGDLAPGNVMFSSDGRPLISELGFSQLVGKPAGPFARPANGAFVAPELAGGLAPSPASDVYAMAALGWFCLTGVPPEPAVEGPSLGASRPQIPPGLVEVLAACLVTDPAARPQAGEVALQVFEAASPESVALASLSDPAGEITRRIRAAAASGAVPAAARTRRPARTPLTVGVVALLVALAFGAGLAWFVSRTPAAVQPVAVRSATSPQLPPPAATATTPTAATLTVPKARPIKMAPKTRQMQVAPPNTSRSSTELVMASSSPRKDAAGLLQALVDVRALAYVARSSALLDLVYASGAKSAKVDRENIATALKNGGTYLGLSFVVTGVAYLEGTAQQARIRATILTPAYKTGQPDGRKITHPREILGPCIFTLSLTPDGWRVLALTTP